MALAMLPERELECITDVGCGDGLFLSLVKSKRFLGVDTHSQPLKHAPKNGAIFFHQFNFDDGVWPELRQSDIVSALDVIEHTLDPVGLLQRMARVGGRVLVTTPNFSFLTHRLTHLLGGIPSVNNERKGHMFFYNKAKLEEVFERAGLKIVKRDYYFPLQDKPYIGKIARFIFGLRPSLFATEFCVLARKKGELT